MGTRKRHRKGAKFGLDWSGGRDSISQRERRREGVSVKKSECESVSERKTRK